MEQIKPSKKKLRHPFTAWHVIGALLLLGSAVGIWFGVHPYYRFLSIGMLAITGLALWKRNWMWWIVCGALLGVVIFLWSFGQAGYRFTSMIPLTAIVLVLVFRFCKRPIRIIVTLTVALLAVLLLLVEIPIVSASLAQPKNDQQYVAVLGAAVYGEKPSVSLRKRVERAITYLETNPEAKVVVSGGQGEGEDISEAECMRRYLVEKGISADRILMEEHSTSTMENLAYSKAVIEQDGGYTDSIAIVSSAYHLYRAEAMARSLGIQAEGVASSDGYPIYMLGMYIREAFAVTKLWVFGAWERTACLASVYASVH